MGNGAVVTEVTKVLGSLEGLLFCVQSLSAAQAVCGLPCIGFFVRDKYMRSWFAYLLSAHSLFYALCFYDSVHLL